MEIRKLSAALFLTLSPCAYAQQSSVTNFHSAMDRKDLRIVYHAKDELLFLGRYNPDRKFVEIAGFVNYGVPIDSLPTNHPQLKSALEKLEASATPYLIARCSGTEFGDGAGDEYSPLYPADTETGDRISQAHIQDVMQLLDELAAGVEKLP